VSRGAILHRFWCFRVEAGSIDAASLSRDIRSPHREAAAEDFAQDLHDETGCLADGAVITVGVIYAGSDAPVRDAISRARFFRVADVVDVYGTAIIEATALAPHETPTLADVEVAA